PSIRIVCTRKRRGGRSRESHYEKRKLDGGHDRCGGSAAGGELRRRRRLAAVARAESRQQGDGLYRAADAAKRACPEGEEQRGPGRGLASPRRRQDLRLHAPE